MPTLAIAASVKRRALALTSLPLLLAVGLAVTGARDARAQGAPPSPGAGAPGAGAPAAGAPAAGAPAAGAPAPGAPADASPISGSAPGAVGGSAAASVTPPAGSASDTSAGSAPPAFVPATPIEDPGAALEREWRERDSELGDGTTLTGGVGLLHMQHAQGGAAGQIRLGFTTEYFSAGFLCTADFPCARPGGGAALTSDSLDHIGGSLSVSASIVHGLELYAGTGAYANSDAQNRPSLIQVLGDTDLGVKFYGTVGRWFHLGAAAELWLINGTGAVGLDGSGTSAKFRLLATGDLRDLPKRVPLRFSVNGTYSLDNTGDVVTATEAARGTSITRIERYGLQVNRVDHIDAAVGVELFAAKDRVRPFVEYGISIPVNRKNYLCKPNNISGDKCLANDAIAPSKLTAGFRVLPWKPGFSVTAAVDIGVTGVSDFIEEVSPQAPWTVYVGAGWAFDTRDRPPVERTKIVEKLVEMRPPPGGRVKGFVHEKDVKDAVPTAIVSFEGHPEITSLATGADGRFTTHELPEGTWTFGVHADGFRDGTCSATLVKTAAPAATMSGATGPSGPIGPTAPTPAAGAPAGTTGAADDRGVVADVEIDCPLEALPRVGRVVGHVRDADTNAPVANATLKLTDAMAKDLSLTSDNTGTYRFEAVSPGTATLTVDADGYMTQVQPVDVKPRADNASDVALRHRPKNPDVAVTAKEITIKKQVQFATDSATILPESDALLTEIADVFLRNPRIRRVEVQGHTDSEGPDEHNQTLSEQRAASVRGWLVAHGVQGERLEAKGYGEKKPLVPNVTPQNRARNRRVQFIILDQDPATPPGAKKPAAAPGAAPKKNDQGF